MTDLVTIFCEIDNFCKQYEELFKNKRNLLTRGNGKRNRKIGLQASEVMTISIWYHFSGFATFKDYYEKEVLCRMKGEFPGLVSYSRFIELKKLITVPLAVFFLQQKLGSCSGISFISSGNVSDNNHDLLRSFTNNVTGKIFGDKGYLVCPEFSEELNEKGITLITKVRNIFSTLIAYQSRPNKPHLTRSTSPGLMPARSNSRFYLQLF